MTNDLSYFKTHQFHPVLYTTHLILGKVGEDRKPPKLIFHHPPFVGFVGFFPITWILFDHIKNASKHLQQKAIFFRDDGARPGHTRFATHLSKEFTFHDVCDPTL